MAVQVPAFATDQGYAFWHLRKMMGALATAGVVTPSTDLIVSPSSGLQVQVTSGAAFVQQTVNVEGSSAYSGLYLCLNDATANPVNTISAPISNSRVDQVILRVYDVNEQGLGGSSKGQLEWLAGTETSGSNLTNLSGAASLPDNSLRLAYVLQTVGEGSISASNILDARPRTFGASNVSASQSTSSTIYTTLGTPDQVAGIILPTNGLIRVRYQATWQESVAGAARAAIFLNANQAQIAVGSTGTVQPRGQAGCTNASGTGINQNQILASFYGGLLSAGRGTGAAGYTGDVTTGQIIGAACDNSNGYVAYEHLDDIVVSNTGAVYGGACEIFATAGTYTVSVQFKASSGSVTASNRKLWVETVPSPTATGR